MRLIRNTVPLAVAIVIIISAILVIENPFRGGNSEGDSEGPVVVDAPERPAQTVGGGVPSEEGKATATETPRRVVAEGPVAPEVEGIKAWINSQPLKIGDLRGKVVLVDFWTYTCVNCIRTFPYLKIWHSEYADDGLVILGVHTPEFSFEEKLENVRGAVKDNGIGWAVALDNDYDTWRAYKNRFWPAKYLIDQDGIIRYTHFGEGAYAETELKIRELLEETGADPSQLDPALPDDQEVDKSYLETPFAHVTRELYAGHKRGYQDIMFGGGYVGHLEYFRERDTLVFYEDLGEHKDDLIYLQGPWYNGPESILHGRETTGFEDYMALRVSAKSVNVVVTPEGEGAEPFEVLITLDGEYLTEDNKGDDVVVEEDGRSFLHVDEPRLYSVVVAPSYGTYDLKLSSNSSRFGVFAFTFGVYESGV